jgi:hypothetical protein
MTLSPPPAPAIRILPPEVAARIAAGEVVERPVSVVRELLDNAIDAGATRISLAFDDGGLTRIEVSDDGRGIPPGDVELAFERHATSKIASVEDLHRVRTLGFRGGRRFSRPRRRPAGPPDGPPGSRGHDHHGPGPLRPRPGPAEVPRFAGR